MSNHKEYGELVNQIENWLSSPISSSREEAISKADYFIAELQKLIGQSAEAGKILGPFLGKVKAAQKNLASMEAINWVAVKEGHLALGHRPSAKLLSDIKTQHGTHILTLLAESEGAKDTKTFAQKAKLSWIWFPMESAKPLEEQRLPELKTLFNNLTKALSEGANIYIHCSAGIHRTGMISYTYLRYLGNDKATAMEHLHQLRTDTYEGVGDERTAWGDSILEQL